ncbi:MAG: polyphosphate polymerase domain-containing protein [Peptococcaceae bacterium]|nr:polyphosphate polymerase domain-containing protein [Peptococcaceae bacterium]
MAQEVFNRLENKYILDEAILQRVLRSLDGMMELDAYIQDDAYTIGNLYYDTDDNHLIRASLAKPAYKEKLRLRAYGVPGVNDRVYVEIKKKVAGWVNKRRSALLLGEAYAFLQSGELPARQPYMNLQVLKEVQYMLMCYHLHPAVYLAYDRRAYHGARQEDLRISFDSNMRARRYALSLEAGDHGEPFLEQGKTLMEIKAAGGLPMWLCKLLSAYKIYPVNYSKYGREYTRQLRKSTQRQEVAASASRILQYSRQRGMQSAFAQ